VRSGYFVEFADHRISRTYPADCRHSARLVWAGMSARVPLDCSCGSPPSVGEFAQASG
jgi:hypothetical protein